MRPLSSEMTHSAAHIDSVLSCAFAVTGIGARIGLQLLGFFGISIASFQVGGGMLLPMSSLSMLNAQPAEHKTTSEEIRATGIKASLGSSIAVVLLIGPATTSTVEW